MERQRVAHLTPQIQTHQNEKTMNKTWFITGAGSGIGTGIAKAALRAGDRVVATGRNLEKMRNAYPDVAQENIAFVQLDVANEAQAKVAVDEAVKRFGGIDVLVNNAGYSLLGNFEQMTTAEIQQQFAPNFFGVVHVMQAGLPVMRRQRSGHIINISSVAGVVGLKHCAAYAATKFAVEGLSLSVATEVEKFGIKVTVVEPGFFRTSLLDAHNVRWVSKIIEDYAPEGTAKDMWSQYDGKQPGDPAKLGDALVQIAAMQNPPKVFIAGGDALDVITPAIEERLREARAHETLSKDMAGSF
jgi:NAD(P)-dependent dehydrogenase (short-subunit alcohol dehydrogenase family)